MAVHLALSSSTSGAASIAMTGSFYSQDFAIPAGSGVSGPSIYVKVSNTGTQQLVIKMSYQAPQDVIIGLSRGEFVLAPGEQQEVQVSVSVAATAVSGAYPDSLKVIAEAYDEGDGGVSVSASAAQIASLTVLNQSANVTVNTVAPSGQPVVSQLRLFRMVGDKGYEVAYGNTGSLRVRVVPGTFAAEAYSLSTADRLCDPVTFDVVDGEDKAVTLTVRMLYFENDFVVSGVYDSQTNELLSARTMATLSNVYEMMSGAEVRLLVTLNGDPLEEVTVLGPLSLPLGQTGVPWNYVPSEGWRGGLYGFRYQLYVNGELMSETVEQTLMVGGGGGVASWLWMLFVALGVVGAAGLGLFIFFLVKRRRKEEEKPRREKKRKEEKPKRKPEPAPAPEHVRQPQPAAPPQPVQTSEPVRPAKPVKPATRVQPAEPPRRAAPPPVEAPPEPQPAPLTSISSLKARMASMGRDQGIGQDTDEEAETEGQEAPAPPGEPQASVTASDTRMPHRPPDAQGPPPVRPEDEVVTDWPPETVEQPEPPAPADTVKPPEPAEPPEAVQPPPPPDGLANLAWQSMEPGRAPGVSDEVASAGAAVTEEPETEADVPPPPPPSRVGFAEAARLRMEARQRASRVDKAGGSPAKGDGAGGTGGGDESQPPD